MIATAKRGRALLLGSLALVLGGCSGYFLAASKEGFEATELKRAAFDLNCPPEKVQVIELVAGSIPVTLDDVSKGGSNTVIGVSGCGKQATYKYVQSVGWVSQSASTK